MRKHALVRTEHSGLTQLTAGRRLELAIFLQALQRRIKNHQRVDACLLKLTQHILFRQALQSSQLT